MNKNARKLLQLFFRFFICNYIFPNSVRKKYQVGRRIIIDHVKHKIKNVLQDRRSANFFRSVSK